MKYMCNYLKKLDI